MFWGGLTVVACNVMGDPPGATGDDGGAATAGIGGGNNGGTAGRGGDASTGDGDADASGGTGATDTGPWWGPRTNTDGCESAGVPKRADRPTWVEDSASVAPFYMAQTRIRFGTTNDDETLTPNPFAWRDIGFDFDETCTGSPTCLIDNDPSRPVEKYACQNTVGVGDGKLCRDNQIGKLFQVAESSNNVAKFFGMSEQDWNCELHRGGFSIIYKVSNYNGQLNDPDVRVDLYNSIGAENPQGWNCRGTDAGPSIAGTLDPNWHSKSMWPPNGGKFLIPSRNVKAGTPPAPAGHLQDAAVSDGAAFVRNGILIASFPPRSEVALLGTRTPVPGFRLILDRGLLAAELKKETENGWTLKGTLAGVVDQGLMIESFEEIGFCDNICGSYGNVIDYLGLRKDALFRADDPASSACDALTYATTVVARQASINATLDRRLPEYGEPLNPECPEPRHPEAPRQNCTCNGNTSVCP
jgi:hypothetical protein